MKNYLKIWLQEVFPRKDIRKNIIYGILKKRNFFNKRDNIFSILPYKNKVVRDAVVELKFNNNIENANFFGELIFDVVPEYINDLKIQENFYNPILLTVPISFWRKLKRGYNQNDLIIKSFMKLGGENFLKWDKDNLKKIKHTKPQSLMKNREARMKNQKNAFKLKYPEKIKNQNIILFDDVYTTGATIKEVKKVLKKAGAKNIKVVILTH